jgi:hypothetical protein
MDIRASDDLLLCDSYSGLRQFFNKYEWNNAGHAASYLIIIIIITTVVIIM